MEKYLLKSWGLRPRQRWGPSLIRDRDSRDSITTETTKSTRVPESMASRPADNFKGASKESGSSPPRANPWGSGSHGRTSGQAPIRI